MALYQVSVNVRAFYALEASSEKEACKLALNLAEREETPDEIEYAGDGIDNVVLIED